MEDILLYDLAFSKQTFTQTWQMEKERESEWEREWVREWVSERERKREREREREIEITPPDTWWVSSKISAQPTFGPQRHFNSENSVIRREKNWLKPNTINKLALEMHGTNILYTHCGLYLALQVPRPSSTILRRPWPGWGWCCPPWAWSVWAASWCASWGGPQLLRPGPSSCTRRSLDR